MRKALHGQDCSHSKEEGVSRCYLKQHKQCWSVVRSLHTQSSRVCSFCSFALLAIVAVINYISQIGSHLTPNCYLLPDELGISKIRATTSKKMRFFSSVSYCSHFSKASMYHEGCRDSMQSTKKTRIIIFRSTRGKKTYLHSDLVIGWQFVQVQYSV